MDLVCPYSNGEVKPPKNGFRVQGKGQMNKGIWNHVNASYIWYHTTPSERLKSILKNGLKINSPPTCQSGPEPWIYLSVEPFLFSSGDVILEVDLEETEHEDAGWPFQSGPGDDEWNKRWQLRVLVDIDPEKIRVVTKPQEEKDDK